MKSWRKTARRRAKEQMIRQRAKGCCQTAQYQKLARSNTKKGRWEEENRRGQCQEMSQMSIGRKRRIRKLYVFIPFYNVLKFTGNQTYHTTQDHFLDN